MLRSSRRAEWSSAPINWPIMVLGVGGHGVGVLGGLGPAGPVLLLLLLLLLTLLRLDYVLQSLLLIVTQRRGTGFALLIRRRHAGYGAQVLIVGIFAKGKQSDKGKAKVADMLLINIIYYICIIYYVQIFLTYIQYMARIFPCDCLRRKIY